MSGVVTVAVVDSGVNVPHPHLPRVAGGVSIDAEGRESSDYVDRLGHGTAAAAAIHEKAPDSEIFAVKVFDEELATTTSALVRAIDWSLERGVRLVNLSLGTPNERRADQLGPAVERAVRAGTLIVSAYEHEDRLWYPGSIEGALGVVADEDHPRGSVTVTAVRGGGLAARAAPYPRPIPGVPRERNLNGISFAVANVTGCLAALLAKHPEARTAAEAMGLLSG